MPNLTVRRTQDAHRGPGTPVNLPTPDPRRPSAMSAQAGVASC